MNRNLLAYLLTYLRNNNNNNNNKRKQEGHTSLIIYSKEKWMRFKHIMDYEDTNPNRLFWSVIDIVLEQFDQKEHSLDKFLDDVEILTPTVKTEPEKTMQYMKQQSIEDVKKLEENFQRNLIYARAITQGEVELDNFVYLWNKYNH